MKPICNNKTNGLNKEKLEVGWGWPLKIRFWPTDAFVQPNIVFLVGEFSSLAHSVPSISLAYPYYIPLNLISITISGWIAVIHRNSRSAVWDGSRGLVLDLRGTTKKSEEYSHQVMEFYPQKSREYLLAGGFNLPRTPLKNNSSSVGVTIPNWMEK